MWATSEKLRYKCHCLFSLPISKGREQEQRELYWKYYPETVDVWKNPKDATVTRNIFHRVVGRALNAVA